MTTYLAYGMAVACDLDLELPLAESQPDVAIERLDQGPLADHDVDWPADQRQIGSPWRSATVSRRSFLLAYGAVAQFLVRADGSHVEFWADEVPPVLLAHLLVDHVLPQVAMRRGRLVLHAACLAAPDGRAYAITGQSGRGKSTLAAALMAGGHQLLGDDCAVIDIDPDGSLSVAASYPGLRLYPQSLPLVDGAGLRGDGIVAEGSTKLRLRPTSAESWWGSSSAPLAALVLLAPAGGTPVGPRTLDPGEAVVAVLRQSFHLGSDAERAELIGRAAALAAAIPVTEVHYLHRPGGLAQTIAVIRRLIGP